MSRILHPPRRCGPAGTGRHDAPLEPLLGHTRHPQRRLALVTRTEPLLPLHRYRASDELTEIHGSKMPFTPKEAHALLRLHGLRLPEHAASALVDRARGWAAGGLRLCALAARVNADANSA